MTVKRKVIKSKPDQYNYDEVINRGGRTTEDSKNDQKHEDAEIRFTLRIPKELINKIDKDRDSRIGNVSRNQWILEAIYESLK
jgi:hypothetical protein